MDTAKSNGNKAFVFPYPDLIPELNHSQAREHEVLSRFMQMNGNARARARMLLNVARYFVSTVKRWRDKFEPDVVRDGMIFCE